MKTKIIIFIAALVISINGFSQPWTQNVLNNGISGNKLGTFNNFPLNIYTNGIPRGVWTTGNALGGTVNGIPLISGDGLRILPQGGNADTSSLDLWTGGKGATTHILVRVLA